MVNPFCKYFFFFFLSTELHLHAEVLGKIRIWLRSNSPDSISLASQTVMHVGESMLIPKSPLGEANQLYCRVKE